MSNAALALAYATLVLVDAKVEVSEANLQKLVNKSGVQVDTYTCKAFARAVQGKDVNSWFASSGNSSSSAPVAVVTAAKAVSAPAPKVEEKPVEEDMDMDMGMFGEEDF